MYDFIFILLVVLPTVALGIWWATRPKRPVIHSIPLEMPNLLFRNGVIEHASQGALDSLPIAIGAHNWEDLHDILAPQYPDFPPNQLPETSGETIVKGTSGDIKIDWQQNGATVTFQGMQNATLLPSEIEELQLLREVNAHLPFPAWKTDEEGAVVWQNDAYTALAVRLPDEKFKASKHLFKIPSMPEGADTCRVEYVLENSNSPEWFNVTHRPLSKGALYYATSLTTLVHAEEAQRDLVQTLAKTFAQLSIGLAVFNRDRQLALFNPALTDLTGLSASFLIPHPTIDTFFDAMRENRRMPEPKNYKTWRQRMADLITAAETGSFEETWTLETGETYRVTGRPHPDGAIAFLIEDISAEISVTRNFRAELELGQSLVDTFEDALAVFSQTGVLTFSNKAYDLLWGFDGNTTFADVTITDAVRLWREKTTPNPLWQDLQDAVMKLEDREEWYLPVCIRGQTPMQCKIVPIASGATVVRFSRQSTAIAPNRPALGKAGD